ncbi:MAG: TIM barrel protein [Candidatus Gastranaerophilaceae bacterium]
MDKLNFITAGMPLRTDKKVGYQDAIKVIDEMNLDGIEIEFVQGVRMSDKSRKVIKEASKNHVFTAHGPYYINLNAREQEKIDASITRIVDTAMVANDFGGYSITYHAAFYLGNDKEVVFKRVVERTAKIIEILEKENNKIWIRPETMGKGTQWGDVDEIIKLSKEFNQVLPCIDFSHVHARSGGGFNTYDDFCSILEKISNELGDVAINNFHAHLAGIAYSEKGEKHHLVLEESDMNYKDLLKAMKTFDVKGVVVCESPNIEDDCKLIKETYLTC